MSSQLGCERCGGCTDGSCHGCSRRWCLGSYLGNGCDRCPYRVLVPVPGTRGAKPAPCDLTRNHSGNCIPE